MKNEKAGHRTVSGFSLRDAYFLSVIWQVITGSP